MSASAKKPPTSPVKPAVKAAVKATVKDFGAVGDGKHDDTKAIQAAIDAAAKTGDRVCLPAGKYLVTKSITLQGGVALQGAANAPRYNTPWTGTIIMSKVGRDDPDGPALFEMGDSTSVSGLTVYYPEQKAKEIHPYSWTFRMLGNDNTVENVTMINSYYGISVGSAKDWNTRHRIRSVYMCALRRGILVDGCSDVGRIDNVHVHGHWFWKDPETGADQTDVVNKYLKENLEAFVIGRSDWEYINNTFVFIAKVGYRFIKTDKGAPSAQMVGIGADVVTDCVVVDASVSWWTLLITNGQFSRDEDPNSRGVVVNANEDAGANGPVRLVNCSILSKRAVVSHSPTVVSLDGCYVSPWGPRTANPLIEADNGRLQVVGCTFDGNAAPGGEDIALRKGMKSAVISANMGVTNGVRITNEIGEKAILNANEPAE